MVEKLPLDTPILHVPEATVGDFWVWAYSDILSNRNRAVFAEFLVGTALGVVGSPRIEWDASDLTYHGNHIEVKASAYVQSWPQDKDAGELAAAKEDRRERVGGRYALPRTGYQW